MNSCNDLILPGPADLTFYIYQKPHCYAYHIFNSSLYPIETLRLSVTGLRTFDQKKSAYRQPVTVTFKWPDAINIGAGYFTPPMILFWLDIQSFGFGDNIQNNELPWPNGDVGPIREWQLDLRIEGPEVDWQFQLDVRWAIETRTLEIFSVSPGDKLNSNEGTETGAEEVAASVIPAQMADQTSESSRPNSATVRQRPESLAAVTGSEEGRSNSLAAYTTTWNCSEAALARTARVDPADLSKWKKGSLSGGSDKSARIENALRNNEPPTHVDSCQKNS
jgi:hypothetical protein